jgi:hypothetical protein
MFGLLQVDETSKAKFEEFCETVKKGKLVLDHTCYRNENDKCFIKTIRERIEAYQFGDNSIIKSDHREDSDKRKKYWRPNDPLANIPIRDYGWTAYYVLKGNKLVSDEKEIKEIVQKATGTELIRIDDFVKYGFVHKWIETKTELDEKYPGLNELQAQPTDEEIAAQLAHVKKYIISLPNNFGFESIEKAGKLLRGVLENAEDLSSYFRENQKS